MGNCAGASTAIAMQASASYPQEPKSPAATKDLLLVVDDAEDMRLMLKDVLVKAGFEVIAVESAAEACRLVRKRKPDLVLLDWDLTGAKGGSGWGGEVLAVCREVDMMLPVVIITGTVLTDVQTDALLQKADSLIRKPTSHMALVSHVQFLLDRRRRAESLFHLRSPSDVVPLQQIKQLYVWSVVALFGGKIQPAAEALGIHRQTVSELLKGEEKNSELEAGEDRPSPAQTPAVPARASDVQTASPRDPNPLFPT
jgi:DNA-binding response OmpR family regulator